MGPLENFHLTNPGIPDFLKTGQAKIKIIFFSVTAK